ncbi:MAG: hypothetical protein JNM43_12180 [Planctomycetaceae bacterium]|nr:hypothetical protein [Planctomycetaceae bacterium]
MAKLKIRNVFAIGREHYATYASAYHKIPISEQMTCGICRRVLDHCRRLPFRKLIWFTTSQGAKRKRGQLGDFTWHGRSDEALISDRLKTELQKFLEGYPLKEVPYENRFELPSVNAGQPIWELTDLPFAQIDLAKTGAELIKVCPECGNRTFNFNAEMNLVVSRKSWDNWHFFSVREFEMMFVTEPVLRCLQEFGATNFQIRRTATLG